MEALHDSPEQEGRDLEVEDRQLPPLDRLPDARVGRVVVEISRDVREARHEALEDVFVQLLAGAHDRLASALLQLLDRPVVNGHADDRTVE